jgi:hypothetical protein
MENVKSSELQILPMYAAMISSSKKWKRPVYMAGRWYIEKTVIHWCYSEGECYVGKRWIENRTRNPGI